MPGPELAGGPRRPRSRKAGKAGVALLKSGAADQPIIVLDHPQLGENIGFAARAMLNCGLVKLRLVAPREDWPNPNAVAAAAGATAVLDAAQLFDDMVSATGDVTRLYATTARPRDMRKPVLTARAAAADMVRSIARGDRVGILFGRERTGLENDDIARADAIIEVPLNPEFSSLNLAQAVLLVGYEWRIAGMDNDDATTERLGGSPVPGARHDEIEGLFSHLEGELDAVHHFYPPEKAPRMVRNLRSLLLRANLSSQEVRSLRGIVKALAEGRGGKKGTGKSKGFGKTSAARRQPGRAD